MDKKKQRGLFNKKKQPDVYKLLVNQCEKACTSSTLLVEFMNKLDPETADKIEEYEKTADEKRSELVYYVKNAFITPVDRHYLFKVSRVLDDLSDEIKDLKDFILYFDYHPTEKNIEMAQLASNAIFTLTDAMKKWNDPNTDDFWKDLKQAKKYQDRVKRLYWENIKELESFESMTGIITMREFCRDLNNLVNKVGKAADRMGDLKIKSIK
ncbi:DUF47 domain-containing protein [Aminicella lysinilytica]|uniref:Putative phosphate transport protein (TIGR00153 family) n=1 Tax=Aminicella lysinilytica TaxID=433323 RepID=A0A4R6QAL1_9FIRM|nr:DUF47 family protein [Aminicella lysinilytica]TDP58956.1 putative phosphate transport protein (TIGR00153 family) [Aminicella lysinilytica]